MPTNTQATAEELMDMKHQVEDAAANEARLQGQLDNYLDQTKDTLGTRNLTEAEKKLTTRRQKLQSDKEKLATATDKLREQYDWA